MVGYTVYNSTTGKILYTTNVITSVGVPDGCDWIAGEYDAVRFKINAETGEPIPFIEQDQFPWLIRDHCRKLLENGGMTDTDVTRLSAARATYELTGMGDYNEEAFKTLLVRRQRILDCAKALNEMSTKPQDFENAEYWT